MIGGFIKGSKSLDLEVARLIDLKRPTGYIY